jgi:hypothetical protein
VVRFLQMSPINARDFRALDHRHGEPSDRVSRSCGRQRPRNVSADACDEAFCRQPRPLEGHPPGYKTSISICGKFLSENASKRAEDDHISRSVRQVVLPSRRRSVDAGRRDLLFSVRRARPRVKTSQQDGENAG